MQLPCDAGSLLFLCLDQPSVYRRDRFFSQLVLSHVNAGPDIARKRTVEVESRHPAVKDPAKFSVIALQTVFHPEAFPPVERANVGNQAAVQIIWIHSSRPPVSHLGLECLSCEIQPRLVEIGAKFVCARHPDEHWRGVSNEAKAGFTFPQNRLLPLAEGDVPHNNRTPANPAGGVEYRRYSHFRFETCSILLFT